MPLGLSYLFYLTFIYSCANGQKSKLYFRHTNKQLKSASVVHSEQRTDPEKCLQVCFRHEWCKSFNSFKMVAGDVEYTCDFFNVDTCTSGSSLDDAAGTYHFDTVGDRACSKLPYRIKFRRTKLSTPNRNFDNFVRCLPDFCIEILDKIFWRTKFFVGQNFRYQAQIVRRIFI